MLNILKKLKDKNIICEFYTDQSSGDSFAVGYVKFYDENYFIIECVSQRGTADGYTCMPIESIIKISYESAYLDKIKKLMNNSDLNRESLELSKGNLLNALLNYLLVSQKISNIELVDNSDFSLFGYIKEVTDSIFVIDCLDVYGKSDGQTVAKIDDITSITFDSEYELNLKVLVD